MDEINERERYNTDFSVREQCQKKKKKRIAFSFSFGGGGGVLVLLLIVKLFEYLFITMNFCISDISTIF